MQLQIISIQATDLALMRDAVDQYFGGEPIVSPSGPFYLGALSGIKAVRQNETVGFACYDFSADVCEIVLLVSLTKGKGVGSALVAALQAKAMVHGCRRLLAFTSNDNLEALKFYERCGMKVAAIHGDAVARVRQYKPDIPTVGANGIPLRDMIELEMALPLGED